VKVVLFCGGLGTRLREHSDTIPKPLVNVGYRPIIWHLMRYYAHFGHKDFVLCLGYRGHMLREYFMNYDECMSNDFTLAKGGQQVELHSSDISDWRITFVDTGLHTNIGQRLQAVRRYLEGEEVFLANYSDGLADLSLPTMLDDFFGRDLVASFASVRPPHSMHFVTEGPAGFVRRLDSVHDADLRVNGGYFVLRSEIFDYMRPGEELVEQPFRRLIEQGRLGVHRHDGFWQPMDTFKDKISFDRMEARGDCPWAVWK
jgi:glucose-1-phosphate cytidylyltransferase